MTDQKPDTERNEILKLLRTKAGLCRTEWLRWKRGDIYNPEVIKEFAEVATPGNILLLLDYLDELTLQVESAYARATERAARICEQMEWEDCKDAAAKMRSGLEPRP